MFVLTLANDLCCTWYPVTKLCRKQSEVIQNLENEHVWSTGQGETRHTKYKRLNLGGEHAYNRD
jgi:hypothetical protein